MKIKELLDRFEEIVRSHEAGSEDYLTQRMIDSEYQVARKQIEAALVDGYHPTGRDDGQQHWQSKALDYAQAFGCGLFSSFAEPTATDETQDEPLPEGDHTLIIKEVKQEPPQHG